MGVALREIIPDGTKWGTPGELLPDWINLEFGQDFKTASSITFDYANGGANSSRLRNGMIVCPEVNGNGRWKDSYFEIQDLSGSTMPGRSDKHTTRYAGYSLRKKLDGVRWLPAIGSVYMDGDAFRYPKITPGAVLKAGVENFLSRAKNQYKDPVNWLHSVYVAPDTNWRYLMDEIVAPTTSVNDMITRYQELGVATARFSGFELTTSHYDYYFNRLGDDTPELKVGVNLQAGEYSETHTNIITALLVRGAEDPFRESDSTIPANKVQWVIGPQSAINKWGYHEHVLDAPDANDSATLKAIGENYLRNHLEPKYSTNYTMVDNLTDGRTGLQLPTPNALEDFQCGDSVIILDSKGATTEQVYAITLSYANPNQAPVIGLTLNDSFQSWEVQFDQRLRRLGG